MPSAARVSGGKIGGINAAGKRIEPEDRSGCRIQQRMHATDFLAREHSPCNVSYCGFTIVRFILAYGIGVLSDMQAPSLQPPRALPSFSLKSLYCIEGIEHT
ncbi:hypothetical protein BFX40_09960 [Mesorhizobium sp. SEMIA 3007]|nr:hypothetical protein BFX40_09960 [Mesorhizobium sp. SEMIA 3007]